jgi:Phosphatidylinositolglycan class N (PIG-N)
MELCIQGKEYFHRYDQLQLKVCISLAYLGWACVLLTFLVQDRIYEDTWISCTKKCTKIQLIDKVALVIAAIIFILLTGNFPFQQSVESFI